MVNLQFCQKKKMVMGAGHIQLQSRKCGTMTGFVDDYC